jgi:dsDNA-specific endonuclease/ATPase MutS2
MGFEVGTDVVVRALRQRGRVLALVAGGRYRVAVGGLTTVCREQDLDTVSHARKTRRHEREAASGTASPHAVPSPVERVNVRELASIDLHGLTVPEALQALGLHLDRAIRAGLSQTEIIHGISGGRVRAAVHGYLAGTPSVARFVPAPHNPGATLVYF